MNNMPIYRHIGYDDETIPTVSRIIFLGKTTNIALSWRNHTEQSNILISNWCKKC